MAASMLRRRTAALCRNIQRISSSKTILSANSRIGFVVQTASYNPKPLKLNISEPYIPDKDSEKTRKAVRRYGSASGVDPASLWPSREQLDKIIEEEKQWHPTLEAMLKNIAAKEKQETEKRMAKEVKREAHRANMAKMPKLVADWRREKRETKQKLKEEKAQRAKLLAEARERFGYKENKKKQKLMKRRLKEEQTAAPIAPPAALLLLMILDCTGSDVGF
uniref:Large ribosomal subunit protein mL64 n=1 Tax=Labrus bergylta TaxID=56723 RepID=A0A3Q3F6N1_9LABR